MLVAVGEQLNPKDAEGAMRSNLEWHRDPLDAMLNEPAFPEGCASRRRMGVWMRLRPGRCVNLLPPGPWDPKAAKAGAVLVSGWAQAEGHRLALMGRRVAAAFGLGRCPFGTFALTPQPTIVLPHPSGRSRFLNEFENVAMVRRAVETFERVFTV